MRIEMSHTLPRRVTLFGIVSRLIFLSMVVSCSSGQSLNETAFVLPERLRLRSSTAQASRFVTELKGADKVTITGRATSEEGAPWVKIKGPGGETGWAEARYFVSNEVVEQSRRLEEEIRNIPTQAIGKSKATLRLRLTPDRTVDSNTATLLPAGTLMEIVGRRRVPKNSQAELSANNGPTGSKHDDWLLIRLQGFAVLPAGWIYGGSVDLELPPDIFYFNSGGRRISGWLKIGTTHGDDGRSGDHYLVMERKTSGGDDRVDFDRIKVLAYEPVSRSYSTPFREDIPGVFPATLKMDGTKGKFDIITIENDDRKQTLSYSIEILDGGKIRVSKQTEGNR